MYIAMPNTNVMRLAIYNHCCSLQVIMNSCYTATELAIKGAGYIISSYSIANGQFYGHRK